MVAWGLIISAATQVLGAANNNPQLAKTIDPQGLLVKGDGTKGSADPIGLVQALCGNKESANSTASGITDIISLFGK